MKYLTQEQNNRFQEILDLRSKNRRNFNLSDDDRAFITSLIPFHAFSKIPVKSDTAMVQWISKKRSDYLDNQKFLSENGGVQCKICGLWSYHLFSHIPRTHHVSTDDYKEKFGEITSEKHRQLCVDRMTGDKNPSKDHGGRLSPFSKKFKKYEGMEDSEIELTIDKLISSRKIIPENNSTNIEYYLSRGHSHAESAKLLSERQRTFSLEKCILKYGEINGYARWKNRQINWQNKINSKPKEEIDFINLKKLQTLESYVARFEEFETAYEEYMSFISRNARDYVVSIEWLNTKLKDVFDYWGYTDRIFKSKIKSYWLGANKIVDGLEYCKNLFSEEWGIDFRHRNNEKKRYSYLFDVYDSYGNEIVLRSTKERAFVKMLTDAKINFTGEKRYPNSKLKYDFFLPDHNLYIEICGFMDDENYRNSMLFKQETFGAVLLDTISDMRQFIETIK